jgi:putative MATE family efflux protein
MRNILRRFFSVEHLLRGKPVYGELPSTRTMYSNLLKIAYPSVMEMVLMSLVGMMDTLMVSVLGEEAIAAIGLTGQPRMLMLSIFFALNIGVTAIVARRKGEERREDANHTLRNAIVLITGLSVVIMGVAILASRPLMALAGAQADTIDDADTYFRILALGIPINALTMCINAAQRGIGNTRITLYVNVVSNAVNIVLNYLLIGGNFGFPRLGVAGAAIASVIGFGVGFVLCVYSVTSKKSAYGFLHIKLHDNWQLKKEIIAPVAKVGSNAVFEQAALRIGFFLYARIVADLGTQAFAAHQICMQFLNITFNFGDGLGVAGTSLVGQMLGQKRPDLSMVYGKAAQRIALAVSLTLLSFIIGLRYPLVRMFTDDPQVISLGVGVMIMVAVFQPFQTSSVVISGCLRGAGDTRFVAKVMMICVTLIRPAVSALAIYVFHLGLLGAWTASLLDMSIRLASVYMRFSGSKWASIKL